MKARTTRMFPGRMLVEKSRSSIDSDGNWLITLSDVLSLLLVFFVMFFVISKHVEKPLKKEIEQPSNPASSNAGLQTTDATVAEKIEDEMNAEIKKLDLEDDVSVRTVDKEVIITMEAKVTFKPGQADILSSLTPMLENIAHVIQRHPLFLVDIEGHTDDVPIRTSLYPSNWELSAARAMSVLKYFINDHGINPSRLSIKGYADQRPMVSNDTPENRAQNRRVEIRLREKEA
jgi:chemotaxis protein MotB